MPGAAPAGVPPIHHAINGQGSPPVLFVHGFACDRTDWDAQAASLSRGHRVVAVDLRGHGQTPAGLHAVSVEGCAADVSDVMDALDLSSAVLVGHSLGCRVVAEAALRVPKRVAGLVLVDGSQFSACEGAAMRAAFASPAGYASFIETSFRDMFTTKSQATVVETFMRRSRSLPEALGARLLLDLCRYDIERLAACLGALDVPVLAIQATGTGEHGRRATLTQGQVTPYLRLLQGSIRHVRVEIVVDTGHFPQVDEGERVNRLIGEFLRARSVSR